MRRHAARRAAEEGKGDAQVVREFSEADGKVTEPASKDGNFYNDERPVCGRCARVCGGGAKRAGRGCSGTVLACVKRACQAPSMSCATAKLHN